MTVRVAGVGAGYFAAFHYDSWQRIKGAIPVAVCDIDLIRAEDTGLIAYTDLDQMLVDMKPDLLDVIVPPDTQAKVVRTALKQGIKWIICQKPFCSSRSEAHDITQEAEDAGATLIVHENFRFQPWYRLIKSALDEGQIGTVQNATFRLRPGDGQGPNAYLDRQPYFQKMPRFLVHETAVHWIDTFRFLFGPVQQVYADLRRLNPMIAGEDAGHILFSHSSGVQALFDGNRHLDHGSDNLRRTMGEALIEGTEGVLSLAGNGSVTLRQKGQLEGQALNKPDSFEGFGGDCVHALQSHVIAALTQEAPLENTARDYMHVAQVEEAIYLSNDTGRKIELNTNDRQ